jgi:hypothetical protein
MIKAAAVIIAPKIKGAPDTIYFQMNPAISEEIKS